MERVRPKEKQKPRGRGRPSIAPGKRRGDRVTLRFTSAELVELQRLADRWGVKIGEALRRCFAKVASEEKE